MFLLITFYAFENALFLFDDVVYTAGGSGRAALAAAGALQGGQEARTGRTRRGRAHACGPGDEDPGPRCARTQTQVCSVLESGRALSLPDGRRYPINPETVSPAENPKPREKHALSSWEVNFTQT